MPDVGGERFADIWRNRHAIMPLSLAAHEKFTGSPVNIAELDGDDLRRSQPKTGHQQRHCIIAPPMFRAAPHGCQQGFHLLGRKMSGKSLPISLGHARHA